MSSLQIELEKQSTFSCLYPLSHLSSIHVSGDTVTEFLQGQMSVDLNRVNETFSPQACYCDLKGRIISLFRLIKHGDCHLMLSPKETIKTTLKQLSMVAMFSKVTLSEHTVHCFGLSIPHDELADNFPCDIVSLKPNETKKLSNDLEITRLNSRQFLFLSKEANFSLAQLEQVVPKLEHNSEAAWKHLSLEQKDIELTEDTQLKFLPQRLNYVDTEVVSVKKGCYVGQEVIARMHFKSKNKYQLVTFKTDTVNCKPGDKLIINNEAFGDIIDATESTNKQQLYVASVLKDKIDSLSSLVNELSE